MQNFREFMVLIFVQGADDPYAAYEDGGIFWSLHSGMLLRR